MADFGDIVLYTGIGMSAFAFLVTEAAGIANNVNNDYQMAKDVYRDLPDSMKGDVRKPNKISFIVQGLWDGPKLIYSAFSKKEVKTALDRYEKPLDKNWLRLHALAGFMEAMEPKSKYQDQKE